MKRFDESVIKFAQKAKTLQFQVTDYQRDKTYVYSSTTPNQRFHSASVGKVFCAVLVMQLVEEKCITLDQPIMAILGEKVLNHLFVYKGVDYKDVVTIEHLLSHTSGINDYFEGKTVNKRRFIDQVLNNQDHQFTPKELLDFTRYNQEAVGKPGQRFLYSDSGYILLAYVLETVHQKSYSDVLKERILHPLKLNDTLLCFYDDRFDQSLLAPIYFKGIRMDQAKSLSCDYAGGGLQTTTSDLATFLHALFTYQLISKTSLDNMKVSRNRFHGIMGYGLGIINVKMSHLVPWMRHYPILYGGLGSLSVHAFYDMDNDRSIIINFGEPAKMRQSFMLLAKTMKILKKA